MKTPKPLLTLATIVILVAPSQAQADRERPDWDSIKKRIESAVERGDLTREQANMKYLEIKKKHSTDRPKPQSDRPAPKRPVHLRPMIGRAQPSDALGKVLGALVQQGKIDRAEVARIRRAAMASRPYVRPNPKPRQSEGHRPGHPEHPAHEMRELLNAAKHELAQIREIRMNLQQAHHHHELEMAERRLMAERRELEEEREAMEHERDEHTNRDHEMRERAEAHHREEIEKARNAKRQAAQREERSRSAEKKRQETRERREQ